MAKKKRAAGRKKPAGAVQKRPAERSATGDVPRCGLCGKTKHLTKTPCCDNWICDDQHKYVLFSYARNSCSRNHDRYTLCAYHFNEGHAGDWKNCAKCRKGFETEIYVYFGTNEYNFEKLSSPPSFEPKKCADCGAAIDMSMGGFSVHMEEYRCGRCSVRRFQE